LRDLLSRYAESAFWMARYIERAENLARILDVNETFSRDSHGSQNWLSVLQLYDDGEHFFQHHSAATGDAVIRYYVTDQTNPGSILSSIRMARENARALRPLISTEMWNQLNTFHNRLREEVEPGAREPRLARLCSVIKENCQAHTGITEGTFYRDAGWYFYQMGRNLERADQSTRLLDVKYHLLLPSPVEVDSPVDLSQWNALLRSASGYHAFRRLHPSGMKAMEVASFLLFNESFPRSLAACVKALGILLSDMRSRYRLSAGEAVTAELETLAASLKGVEIEHVISQGLHEYIDRIQQELITIANMLGQAYFGGEAAEARAESGQAQG
jgi:uncharacterized alpha-E superfamily protein